MQPKYIKVEYEGKVYPAMKFNHGFGSNTLSLVQLYHNSNIFNARAACNYSEGKYGYANNVLESSVTILPITNKLGGKLITLDKSTKLIKEVR